MAKASMKRSDLPSITFEQHIERLTSVDFVTWFN